MPVAAELAGQPMPEAVRKSISLKLDHGKYEVFVREHPDRGTYTIDAGTRPKSMTIAGTEGPNHGKTFPAIYELKGDTLRICYDLARAKRPNGVQERRGHEAVFSDLQPEEGVARAAKQSKRHSVVTPILPQGGCFRKQRALQNRCGHGLYQPVTIRDCKSKPFDADCSAASSVLLRDAARRRWLRFSRLREVVSASGLADVAPGLRRVEEAVAETASGPPGSSPTRRRRPSTAP